MQKTHQHIINFLNALKDEGFAVGVDTHLQVWTILQRLPQNTRPETIADYLCPLFSQSDLEQAKFHEVFKSHAHLLDLEIQEEKREAEEKSHNSKPETDNLKPPKRSKYILIGGLITATLIIISWFYPLIIPKVVYGCKDKSSLNYNPEATIDTTELCQYPDTVEVCMQEGFANYQDISTLDTIRTIYIACANCCLEIDTTKKKPETTPIAKAQKDSTTYIVPFEPKEVNLPDLQPISGTLSYWLYKHKTPIAIALSLLFLGFFVAKWLYDKKQDEYNVQRSGDDDPPYILPIKITNKKGIAFNEKIKTVFSQLRGREASAVQRINLKKTIDATIKKGGFIDIRYQQQTRPSEYLILIDKNSELNHQAQLFEHVYQLIKQEEVHVARYFYDDDIRYCWNEEHPTGITIERLTHLYSEARLLIFSDGYSFIDRNNNEIAKWLKPVEHWTRRALMTPAPMAGWNFREGILAQVFVMLPANIQGFLQVVDHFETLKPSDLKAWKYEIGKADKPLELDKENFVADLQRHFSPEMFRWIAACAVYPDLHWDLTVRIGHALSEGRENLVTHSNLIELTRLRWFQRGYMTLSVREELLAEENLSKEDRQKVRAVIIEVLEENIPDNKKSYAFKEHQLQLAINHLLLDRIGEDRRKWLKIAAAMQQQGVNDPVSIQALKDKENRFLGFQLPERFVNFFFKGGIRTFGVENWVSITLLCIGLLGIWGTNLLWQNAQYNNPVVLGENTYGLATASDTVDFYILQEVWNWEQVGNQSDLRSEVPLDWETALKNIEFEEIFEGIPAATINHQNKLRPILLAQYNAYVALYDTMYYGNILQADRSYTPNPIWEAPIYSRLSEGENIPVYNPTIQNLQLDILQIVGLAEFYTQKEQKGTAFINYLQSEKLTDSTRTNYTQQNVPNLYHFLQYDFVDSMAMNRVRVAKYDNKPKYGFLDSLGNPTWTGETLPYDYVSKYNEDNKAIRLIGTQQCVINKAEQVIDCFKKLTPYQNNNGKWGYINENNTLIIDAEYDEARPFGENNAVVKKSNRYGMIDKSGAEILPFDYSEIGKFVTTSKIAKVKKGNHYGYISEDLSINLDAKYSKAANFEGTTNLTAAVTLDGKNIRINTKGECVQGCEVKYTIKGKVRNDENTPIANVTITTTEYGTVKTDNNGNYIIEFEINEQLPLSIELTIDGGNKYLSKKEVITFTNDLLITKAITLEKVPEQQRIVKGTITDKNTRQPIANATINVLDRDNDKNYIATSNNQGEYTINMTVNTKDYSIAVTKKGYAIDRKDVTQTTSEKTVSVVLQSEEIRLISEAEATTANQSRVSKKYNPNPINESRDADRKYFVGQGIIKLGVVKINSNNVITRITDINADFDNGIGLETTMAINETKYISYETKIFQITLERINNPTLGRKTVQFDVMEWSENIPIPQTIFVKGGSFQMGSNEYDSEKPIHTVNVKDFNIGKYEVTNAEFAAFLNAKGNQEGGATWALIDSDFGITENSGKFKAKQGLENHPVIQVSWYGARAYCKWLSETTGQTYRLPTEAEWEYAARGGNQSKGYKYSGSNTIDEVAWYDKNSYDLGTSHPNYGTNSVGTKKANELGIFDMSGNVWEWCEDTWHDSYLGAPGNGTAWLTGGNDSRRVLRGGSWYYSGDYSRVANRLRDVPSYRYNHVGFRLARGI